MTATILIVLLIFATALGYGRFLLKKIGDDTSLLIGLGLGLWVVSLLVFLAGLAGWLNKGVLIAIVGLGIVLLIGSARSDWRKGAFHFPALRPWSRLEGLLVLFCALLLLMAASGALSPPSERDSLIYHLALPKIYLEKGQWVEIPSAIFGYFPGLMEALYTLALGLGAHYPALLHYGFGLACLSGTLSLAKMLGVSRKFRLLAAIALASTPTFWSEMTWAYVDLVTTFYFLLVLLSFFRWTRERKKSLLVVLGFAIGAANCSKYTSLLLFVLLPLGILVLSRDEEKPSLRTLMGRITVPIGVGILVASPWWFRNIILVHNPFYPFFWAIFPTQAVEWDANRSALYQMLLDYYGGSPKDLLDYFLAPFRVFWKAKINDPALYDGSLGPYYLLIWPLFLFAPKKPKAIYLLLGLVVIYLVYWTFSSQQARFLLVILPVLTIMVGWLAELITISWKSSKGVPFLNAAMTAVFLCSIGINIKEVIHTYQAEGYLDYLTNVKDEEQYLKGKLRYYDIYQYINNNLPEDSRLFLVMTGNQGYYLNRPYFSDAIFEGHTLANILSNSPSPEEIIRTLRTRGFTHLLIQPDFFIKEQASILPPATMDLFSDLLKTRLRLLQVSGSFFLFEIP